MSLRDISEENSETRHIGLLLVDGFALMSYASVVEAYRAANVLAGRQIYRWTHISTGGEACHASNGATIAADAVVGSPRFAAGQGSDYDTLFVIAGGDPLAFSDARTFAWLRAAAARGTVIAGISAGPYLLARAGLLDSYRATIHWEHRPAFAEHFPLVSLEAGLYVIDRRRVTCAGGMAAMDLVLELIEREQGHMLSSEVSDWFIRSETRAADRPQRLSLRDRYKIANDRMLKVLAHMEATVAEPVDRETLAKVAGVSVRQLERLFAAHFAESVSSFYKRTRLMQAEQLLRSTGLSVTDVALACGFKSSSHFSRAYRELHGEPPREARLRRLG